MGKFISIGSEHYIAVDKVVSVIDATTHYSKGLVKYAKDNGFLLNYTLGKKARSLLLTTENMFILSPLSTKTIIRRFNGEDSNDIDE